MKAELCPNCNRPMKLARVMYENQSVMKCKHCRLERIFTYEKKAFPSNINSFNWGAFALWPFWGFGNNMTYLFILYFVLLFASILLPIIPSIIILIYSIYLGFKGNRLSWENKNLASIERFEQIQHKWNIAGIIIIAISIISSFISVISLA